MPIVRRAVAGFQPNATRRAASTLSTASPLLHPSHPPPKPPLPARGRNRLTRGSPISTRLSAAKLSRSTSTILTLPELVPIETSTTPELPRIGRGRKRNDKSKPTLPHQVPFPSCPASLKLHLSLNPPHLPLPIPLGHSHYTSSKPSTRILQPSEWTPSLGPFAVRPTLSISQLMADGLRGEMAEESSVLDGHFGVLNVLGGYNLEMDENDDVTEDLSRYLAEMNMKNQLEVESSWQAILTKLGDKPVRPIAVDGMEGVEPGSEMEAAVGDLKKLLTRLDGRKKRRPLGRMVEVTGPEGEVEVVWMDSTRRKRRKKITKHKFKKRRKATAALRKKLKKD